MKRTVTVRMGGLLLVAGAVLTLAARPAEAADFYLQTVAYDLALPDGATVPMWGYSSCDATFTTCGPPSSPAPTLVVPDTEPTPVTVNIHLKNDLPVATSLIIPAQLAALHPKRFADPQGRSRAASLTDEVATGGAVGVYTWHNFRPGTFLFHSGSRPQVQVQMGLLGAITYSAGAGQAYAGVPFDSEALIVYSELDPGLHAAVAGGIYGTPLYPSTFNYKPTYFLVNGAPYTPGQAPISAGAAGTRVLLRLVNGALTSRAPTLLGGTFDVVAENGHKYPYPSRGYGVLLPAGSTKDAILVAPAAGTYPLFDRYLNLTSNQATGGGAYAFLAVSAGSGGTTPPVVAPAPASSPNVIQTSTTVGQAVRIPVATSGLVDPRSVRVAGRSPGGGTVVNNGDGTVTYRPPAKGGSKDSFSYTARLRRGRHTVSGQVLVTVKRSLPRPGLRPRGR